MRSRLFLSALALGLGGHGLVVAAADTSYSARSGTQVMPLVELYTSEGCSSCPPADRWLSRQLPTREANFLAFHVDYWDRLGWVDRFASPDYSAHQRRRVNAAGGRIVYTPQVMLGEQIQVPWHDDAQFSRILAAQRQPASVTLQLRVEPSEARRRASLEVTPVVPEAAGATVWLARYIDDQTTVVRAGENGGVTLHHSRVVQRLWGPWPVRGTPLSMSIEMPADVERGGFTLFAQNARGQVLQSLSLADGRCH